MEGKVVETVGTDCKTSRFVIQATEVWADFPLKMHPKRK